MVNGLKNIVANTGLQGRWQILQKKPMIICDTAHNEAAIKEVVYQLTKLEYYNIHFIIGFSDDKDLEKISKIFPVTRKILFCQTEYKKRERC